MKISALHIPVDVYIFRYRPAHEAFIDKRNSISYGKGTSRCHCTAIYMKHTVRNLECIIHKANCGLGVGGS